MGLIPGLERSPGGGNGCPGIESGGLQPRGLQRVGYDKSDIARMEAEA